MTGGMGMPAPEVSDAMVQAAIGAVLDLRYDEHPLATHRHHDASEGGFNNGCGGYDYLCPLCRVSGARPEVSARAREKVFRAALEAGLAVVLAENAGRTDGLRAQVGELTARAVRAEAEASRFRRLDPGWEAACADAAEGTDRRTGGQG